MWAVIAGVLGFLVAYLFDWVSLRRIPGGKQAIALSVVGLHSYALVAACWGVTRFSLPSAFSVLGWFLLPISLVLLLYSLFLELPYAKTYSQAGVGQRLVTSGTYALVRHPWVLWYVILLAFLIIATRSTVLLYAVPAWVFMAVMRVVVEDRFFFPKMFPDYPQYQQQTPMLIPTRSSIATCLRTLKAREA